MSSKTKSTDMKDDGKSALVPKLRFPEFRDAPGWEPKRLGLVLKFQAGFPFPSSGFNDAGKGLRLIRNRDLRSDDIVKFYSEDFDLNFVVNNGDVLVGMDGDFTPTVWEKGEALLNQRVGRILPREDNDHRFLLYLLTLCLKGIEEATARTTVKHLSHSAVEDKHEPLPSPTEQQKIAECLNSVDELMAAQARKLDALKTHKKGLMQQFFPREGETQPRLRFPEFQQQWVETQLGNLCSSISSGRDQIDPDGAFDLYGSTSVIGKTRNPSFSGERILVARVGMKAGLLTKANGEFGVTDNTLIVGLNSSIHIDYIFYWLENTNINRLIFGSGQPLITGSILKSLRVLLPADSEQRKISACLSTLDEMIIAQSNKVEALKSHKQGLMQQLFPSPEEIEA